MPWGALACRAVGDCPQRRRRSASPNCHSSSAASGSGVAPLRVNANTSRSEGAIQSSSSPIGLNITAGRPPAVTKLSSDGAVATV